MMDEPDSSDAIRMTFEELSRRWIDESKRYVNAINHYVQLGEEAGWENFQEQQPEDTRQSLAEGILQAIRRANETDATDNLGQRFPRAHGPFIDMLDENGQSLPTVFCLDDDRIIVRIGASYETGKVIIIDDKQISPVASDVITIGRSPNRNFFAVAREDGVTISLGWEGTESVHLRWPTGREGIPDGFETDSIDGPPIITQLIPFDTGDRALLVSPDGVFVMTEDETIRLLPTLEQLEEHFQWLQEEYPDDTPSYDLSMEHACLSPDGRLIAAGHQSSLHYVFDAQTYKLISEVGHLSEYPHYAVFSSDGNMVAFNSCHFYNGITIGVPTHLLPGLQTEPYQPDKRLTTLEEGSRVYAAVARDDEFIIGDASGYLRAFDLKGNARWRHFLGSTIGNMDLSADGKQLIVTTYAGFLSILDLDQASPDPMVIGNSKHHESRRWLFWKQEEKPLIW
ncbi:WD40 repeat domain-containing protein [Bremerella cremea]|uniref:WD40 repeat domain-containing protein n=1 Tax=Blastopirellula marina TaxID=124 RepID=A0A2S8FYN3_9BACT|nr:MULTISPECIES: WD40 repeat domain-containing protein [Pirellulaceae]PQO37316.1 hypothetical protein C5Y83_05050 [Blastopirellula marina]RCS49703.1 WD40 repeat domain-containing protein [Bremerella cremea]